MKKTIEERVAALKQAGHIGPDDLKNEEGKQRSLVELLEIGNARAGTPVGAGASPGTQEEKPLWVQHKEQALSVEIQLCNDRIQTVKDRVLRDGTSRASERELRKLNSDLESIRSRLVALRKRQSSCGTSGTAAPSVELPPIVAQYTSLQGDKRMDFYREHSQELRRWVRDEFRAGA